MANSKIINKAKNKIIKEFIKSDEIIQAIDSSSLKGEGPEKYVRTHIFDYAQNPETLNDVGTFIFVLVSIPEVYYRDRSEIYIRPRVEVWVFSHYMHMRVDNIPKVTANRNDYIAMLVDEMINGRSDFGIGKLKLVANLEGTHSKNYLYRQMIFELTDLNDALCDD